MNAKRYSNEPNPKKNKKKIAIVLVSVLAACTVAAGSSLAFLFTNTDPVVNAFEPSRVTTSVDEKIDHSVKNEVKIQNTGDIKAYIRADVVVTWQDAKGETGNIYGKTPVEGVDYTMTWSGLNDSSWIQGDDGFYYYTGEVLPGGYTSELFTNCKVMETAEVPEGYELNVEILGSGIQSTPDKVVGEAWSNDLVTVTGNSGTLTVMNKGG